MSRVTLVAPTDDGSPRPRHNPQPHYPTPHTCAWRTRCLVGGSGSPDRADLQGEGPRVLGDLGLDAVSVRTLFAPWPPQRGHRESLSLPCSITPPPCTPRAEYEDDLRKVGYFKERRVDSQVIVGLLGRSGWLPLQIGCWAAWSPRLGWLLPRPC